MSRRFWGLLASSAVLLAVVLAVVRPGGPSDQKSFAHVITATPGVEVLHLELDMNVTNGNGPCDPVDASAAHGYNDTYQVAVCVTGLEKGTPIDWFTFDVIYDDTLNKAPEVADLAPALDDNPDANAGTTRWPTNISDGLGSDWDCLGEDDGPKGDTNLATGPGNGDAFISCGSGTTRTLGDNETAGVLAVITFTAQGVAATDTLTIANAYLVGLYENNMGTCNPVHTVEMPCFGGTDIKVAPPHRRNTRTPTPTATPVPTEVPPTPIISPSPTPTMFGGPGGRVVKPPPTGSGPSGGGSPPTVWLFALAGIAGAAAVVDGFRRFARRSRT